jgi:hypothetical protein
MLGLKHGMGEHLTKDKIDTEFPPEIIVVNPQVRANL